MESEGVGKSDVGSVDPSPAEAVNGIVRFGIDSGACTTVLPARWFKNVSTTHDMPGQSYRSASGDKLEDQGGSRLHVKTASDRNRVIRVRRAAVTKPLMAVASILDAGGSVHFGPERSYIVDSSGCEEDLVRKQNVFHLPVRMSVNERQ